MSLKWIIIAVLALPLAELVVYLLVAEQIGFLRALALQLACSLAGFVVLRQSGREQLARLRARIRAGPLAGLETSAGGAAVLGGILLLIPGFITDLIGLALLVPPLRRGLGTLARQVSVRYQRTARSPQVIDLEPDQWHEVKTRKRVDKRSAKRRS